MKIKTSIKLSDSNREFLNWVSNCHDFQHKNKGKRTTPSKALDYIEKYFKLSNDRFVEMIKMEKDK